MKPQRANKPQTATIPAVRMFSEELQRIKQASTAQRLSLSEFIRRTLLSAIPQPFALQLPSSSEDKKKDSLQSETDGPFPRSEAKLNDRSKKCVHGFKVRRGATQCFQCANFGVKYRE